MRAADSRFILVSLLTIVCLILGKRNALFAQVPPEIEIAQMLEERGEYAEAAEALRPYLQTVPDDMGTHWYFARLLHWAGAMAKARDAYEVVVDGMPGNPWVKLEYAQVLLDMGEWSKAREVLLGVVPEGPPEATAAAQEKLAVIRSNTRPWGRINLAVLDDNQPYRRYEGLVETGVYLTPLWSVALGGEPRRLDVESGHNAGDAWAQLQGYLHPLRLHLTVTAGGVFQGSDAVQRPGLGQASAATESSATSWLGAGELGFDLSHGWKLVGLARRSRYLWTRASVDSLVMMNTAELRLDRVDAPGWAVQAVGRRAFFGDDNVVTVAYAWILAPLVKDFLRVGYAFSWSDARESRWERVQSSSLVDPGTPLPLGATIPGRYAPYHTPEEEQVHSALAELSVPLGAVSFRLNGSVGVHAREQAPVLIVTGVEADPQPGAPAELGTLYFYERSFTPWRLTFGGSVPLSRALTLHGDVQAWETAYYEVKQFSLGLVYRFGVRDLSLPSTSRPGP